MHTQRTYKTDWFAHSSVPNRTKTKEKKEKKKEKKIKTHTIYSIDRLTADMYMHGKWEGKRESDLSMKAEIERVFTIKRIRLCVECVSFKERTYIHIIHDVLLFYIFCVKWCCLFRASAMCLSALSLYGGCGASEWASCLWLYVCVCVRCWMCASFVC